MVRPTFRLCRTETGCASGSTNRKPTSSKSNKNVQYASTPYRGQARNTHCCLINIWWDFSPQWKPGTCRARWIRIPESWSPATIPIGWRLSDILVKRSVIQTVGDVQNRRRWTTTHTRPCQHCQRRLFGLRGESRSLWDPYAQSVTLCVYVRICNFPRNFYVNPDPTFMRHEHILYIGLKLCRVKLWDLNDRGVREL